MGRGICAVCDSDNTTNFHFGAQTCKACAAFFRRTICAEQQYECIGDGIHLCAIDLHFRLNCRYCRLKKCLRAGMRKDMVQSKKVMYRNLHHHHNDYPPLKLIEENDHPHPLDPFPIEIFGEEDELYELAQFYITQVLQLNMRRRITYTEKAISSFFDPSCVCPYLKSELRPFDYHSHRRKNRIDYIMILDYVNRFPDFELLNKSEKNVIYRSALAIDMLIAQAFYSQTVFPDFPVMVTSQAEYLEMDCLNFETFGIDEDSRLRKSLLLMLRRQWENVIIPLKKLNMSLVEYSLFKALTIWHYNYFKLQENGRQISARQRDRILKTLLLICRDEGHPDAILRVSELVLSVGIVLGEVYEMITSFIEIMVFDDVDDPILREMLKFQY